MKADVVIVTWRERELTMRCLEHLAAQTAPCQVIVVDNASGDGTPAAVRERFPDVIVVELAENRGFGGGVNAGVAAGVSPAVVLLNNDAFAEPDMVAELVAPLDRDPRVGMVAGMTLLPDGRVDGYGVEVDATLAAYNRLRLARPDEPARGVLLGPEGCIAAFRRVAFEAVGGFDERLFAYGEDVDLALRVRAAGWSVAEAPAARAEHHRSASFGVDSPHQRRLAGFGRGFLLRRYGVLRSRAAGRALAFEVLVCAWGLLRHRTLVPVRARIAGWHAAGRGHVRVPAGAVDPSIGWREAFARLRERAGGD